jgi:nicotinamide mononucleotide transporter
VSAATVGWMEPLQPLLAAAFTLWGSPVTWLEIVAFVLAVWMVVCNMRVDPLAWPLAIASSALYGLLFVHSALYGEAHLQLLFIVVAFWGWWQWLRGRQRDGSKLAVRWLTARGRIALAGLTLAAWPLLGWFLDHRTDSDVPYWDAFPTAASVAGQWLLGRKYVENWPTWVVVNVASVALFAIKGLWLTVLLYALFTAMSFAGWRAWQRMAAR